MLLSGWKEIAAYLRCGVRTVQRWELLGLPVARPARSHGGSRGLVLADSEKLDSWLHNHTNNRMRLDVAANIERAKSLQQKIDKQLQLFLKSELSIAMTYIRLSVRSQDSKKASRYRAIARETYDTIIHLSRPATRRSFQFEHLDELAKLKAALRKLGEPI